MPLVHRCPLCQTYQALKFNALIGHIRLIHSQEPNFSIKCGISSCEKTYTKLDSYLQHRRRVHKVRDLPSSTCIDSYDNSESDQGHSHAQQSSNFSEQTRDSSEHATSMTSTTDHAVGMLVLKLREKHQIPESHVSNVLKELKWLMLHTHRDMERKLKHCFDKHDLSTEIFKEVNDMFHENELTSALEHFSSVHNQTKYFKEELNLVEPIEKHLSCNEKGGSDTYVYTPVLDVLHSLLRNDDVFSQIVNASQCENSNNDIIASFTDGQYFQDNSLFCQSTCPLQLVFFNDDFEVCNPIGTFTKKHKINAMYYTIGNIPWKLRSKLHMIQVAWLCKSKLIVSHGFEKVSEALVKDLQLLEKEGITIFRDCKPITFKGTISFVAADNLGSHSLGGFMEGFNATRFCRFCMCTNDALTGPVAEYPERSKEAYQLHAQKAEQDKYFASVYGIKRSSPLNKLLHFHVVSGLPSDPMHDLFEGVCPLVVGKTFTEFLNSKYVTFELINERITSFDYKGTDKVNRPSKLSKISSCVVVKQTAAQMWCFMRLLFVMFGDKIPESDKHWQLLIALVSIVDLVFATKQNGQSICYLDVLVRDFLEMYMSCFPGTKLTPKMHYLTHYSKQITQFGPLSQCCTFRFEAKHSYMKNIARHSKNKKNICLSLSKKHQRLQCLYAQSENLLTDDNILSSFGHSVGLESCDPSVREYLRMFIGCEKEVFQVSSATVRGLTYHVGCALVTGVRYGLLQFARILAKFLKDSSAYFMIDSLNTLRFSDHYHCFFVEDVLNQPPSVLPLVNCNEPYPLEIYCNGSNAMACIVPKYRLIQEFMDA